MWLSTQIQSLDLEKQVDFFLWKAEREHWLAMHLQLKCYPIAHWGTRVKCTQLNSGQTIIAEKARSRTLRDPTPGARHKQAALLLDNASLIWTKSICFPIPGRATECLQAHMWGLIQWSEAAMQSQNYTCTGCKWRRRASPLWRRGRGRGRDAVSEATKVNCFPNEDSPEAASNQLSGN